MINYLIVIKCLTGLVSIAGRILLKLAPHILNANSIPLLAHCCSINQNIPQRVPGQAMAGNQLFKPHQTWRFYSLFNFIFIFLFEFILAPYFYFLKLTHAYGVSDRRLSANIDTSVPQSASV